MIVPTSAVEAASSSIRILICVIAAAAAVDLFSASDLNQRIQAHYQRGQEAQRQNRYEEAAAEYQQIIQLDPKLAEAHANLGVVYYLQSKYKDASQSFHEALRLKPALSRAQALLGMSEAKSGHIQQAMPILEKTFGSAPHDEWWKQTGLLLVELYYGSQDFDKAIGVVGDLQKAFSGEPQILYLAYRIHSDLGSKVIAELVRAAPDAAYVHQVTAELLQSEGDFPRAVAQYRKAIAVDPKLSGLHRALGVALLQAHQDEPSLLEAQKQFEVELALNERDANAEYLLGEIFWRRNDRETALRHFTRAAELRPNFVDALIALGKVWTAQGQADKALACLLNAVRLDPQNEVAHYRMAQVYQRSGNPQMAEHEMALFRKFREASASIGAVYRQVQRNPIVSQSIESEAPQP